MRITHSIGEIQSLGCTLSRGMLRLQVLAPGSEESVAFELEGEPPRLDEFLSTLLVLVRNAVECQKSAS
jgi:hypothetical protein